ncbi:1,4-alpha-glucan branching protein [Streptomyces sp. WAC 01529]|uniref:maltokinase N-terminal cap-like domain-containing protein n=1 Tax=Streptomyces sp. WAC 01529 TaxID=2203205 RepID=UPI000F71DBD9|nr:1,4-alpha-glucan branching protein [Streptomyces sp. WAC 01529]AZM56456.1 1,4-alpha-glucan branching protein [Streptomyces sp. WAC 01529]
MAVIHQTELKPTKLELLTSWLPSRSWYSGSGEPELVKAGGFRLDDPEGEVGIEFIVVTDTSGARPTTYLVPLTYRGAPLDGAEHALVGTMEHGVLGPRWAYDGCHDPVLAAQLLALVEGRVQAQAQSVSDALDRDVTRSYTGDASPLTPDLTPDLTTAAADGQESTELPAPQGMTFRLQRVLRPAQNDAPVAPPEAIGHVAGVWQTPDGSPERGLFATLYS